MSQSVAIVDPHELCPWITEVAPTSLFTREMERWYGWNKNLPSQCHLRHRAQGSSKSYPGG
jgi:hypothetical protein